MSNTSSERDPIDQLAEEFLARFRRGERPSVAEYADRYPELADEIRQLFPALVMMEHAAPGSADHSGSLPKPSNGRRPAPDRLGDFRILREVGRGGMGVVYEAIQESLGRHVALKMLPPQAILDPSRLRRFQREAKAAANLHHTNIVPVYGVGEYEGTHYYAMQFIRGQGLECVIEELRRLREDALPASVAPRSAEAVAAARSLLSGEFIGARSDLIERPGLPGGPYGDATCTHVPGAEGVASSADLDGPSAPSANAATSSAVSGTLTDTGRHYWESVARLGAQVADALAHAHAQGIIHRDVKPSNLLLDPVGTVWVTDFGLAKVTTDADDLSHTGDILGTLRYMAPERFNGEGDARADVYALGLTLYELLTFRPAFEAESRQRLVEMVMHVEPLRPRRLNPAVPRDLETVILKATAKDPAQRYPTATALATDLRRFVEDRPILARRASPAERAWRWCRRNPLVASLIGTVATLLVAITIVSMVAAARDRAAFQEKQDALIQKQAALETAQAAVKEKEDALRAEQDAVKAKQGALVEKEAALAAAQNGKKLALKAVDDMWVAVAEKWLEDAPELELVQREFLQKAMALYQELARDGDRDPEVRFAIALAHRKIGEIHSRFDEPAEAEKAHAASVAELTALVAEHPDDRRFQFELGVSCCFQAWRGITSPSRRQQMGQVARRGLELFEKLTAAAPDDVRYQEWLAFAHYRLGATRLSAGDAAVDYRIALKIFEPLAAANPGNSSLRRRFHLCQESLALALPASANGLAEAEDLLRKSVAGCEQLMKDFPREHVIRWNYVLALENLAHVMRRTERMAEAEKLLTQVIGLTERLMADFPNAPRYRRLYARSLNALGTYRYLLDRTDDARDLYVRAIAQYEHLMANHKDKHEYVSDMSLALDNLGNLRLKEMRYPDAEIAYRRAVEVLKGQVGEIDDDAAARRPLSVSYNRLVACLHRANRPEDALAVLQEQCQFADEQLRRNPAAVLVGDFAVFAHFRLGMELSLAGKYDEAEKTLQQAREQSERMMDLHPEATTRTWNWPAIQVHRGINFLRSGQPDKTLEVNKAQVEMYDQWLAANPNWTVIREQLQNAHANRAWVQERLGRPAEAEAAARQQLDVASRLLSDRSTPANRTLRNQALARLTRLMHHAGKTDEAVELVQREHPLPEQPRPGQTNAAWRSNRGSQLNGLALRLGHLDRTEEAEKSYQEALAIAQQLARESPTDVKLRNVGVVQNNLANLFARNGQNDAAAAAYREALTAFERLNDQFPNNPADRNRLAHEYHRVAQYFAMQGHKAEAEHFAKKALAALVALLDGNPTSPLYLNNLAWYLCTCPVPSLRDPQRAINLAEKAVNVDETPTSLNTLGVAYYRAGNWQTAVALLQQAVHVRSGLGNADDFYFLAMAKWQLGDRDAAQKYLKEAIWLTDTFSEDNLEKQDFRAEAERLTGSGGGG